MGGGGGGPGGYVAMSGAEVDFAGTVSRAGSVALPPTDMAGIAPSWDRNRMPGGTPEQPTRSLAQQLTVFQAVYGLAG